MAPADTARVYDLEAHHIVDRIKPLDGEVHGFADELLVFVVEDVRQLTDSQGWAWSRRHDVENLIAALMREKTLREKGTRGHIVEYRYLIRKGHDTTEVKEYKQVQPMRVELYKGKQRAILRVPPGELQDEQLKQIMRFFQPKRLGYDPTHSTLSYSMRPKPHFEPDAMDDLLEGEYGRDGALINMKGIGTYGPDGEKLFRGDHHMRYGPDGFLEPILDARPRHGAHVQRGWYRAESGRLEIEDVAVRRFHLICNVVDLLKKTGRIQTGRWTNDPEVFPDDLLREQILPFPPNDRQRYCPQEFCDTAGETVVIIRGAEGNNSNVINGEYALVGSYNGKGLFQKLDRGATHHEDHANKWLRYSAARKTWMVGDTKDVYVNNSAGWCCSRDLAVDEPWQVRKWMVMNNKGWEDQALELVHLVSTEARFKRRVPNAATHFEESKKPTWHRLTAYATFPNHECRVFPIAQGSLTYGHGSIDGISMGRVWQGGLSNAYFVEALNAISLRPALVRRLFFAYDCAKSVYSVRLFKNGVWLCVEVDDFVPKSDDKAFPLCCRHEQFPQVLWPSIVEKAYAKACTARFEDSDQDSGGWEAIGGGGRVEEALVDLTGGVGGCFSARDVSPDRLFVYFHEMQRYCLWVCRVNLHAAVANGMAFNPYANYAVNRAVHFQGECFVQLRCVDRKHPDVGLEAAVPWDLHPELLKAYPGRGSEGYMWLSVHDFHQYFDEIFECRLVNSPDVGIAGMPAPSLPIAKMFPDPDWVKWAKQHLREREDPLEALNDDVDLSHLFDPQRRASSASPLLPVNGVVPGATPGTTGMPGSRGGAVALGAVAKGAGHAWEQITDRSPVFYEHVFATEGSVTAHKPPQLAVTLPEAPCEIAVACEQVDNRLFQVGKKRKTYPALLLKVYQKVATLGADHGKLRVFSQDLVCKSEWTNTRSAMVAWRCKSGGEFKVLCNMGAAVVVDRLIFRVYASVPYVDAHVSPSLTAEKLVEDKEPPRGIKCTLCGSVVPERLFRTDRPEPLTEDLDELRVRHQKEKELACPTM
mmetsp:Transcript_71550/g.186492  ORF Transcript_71550/g.186492 Transcript_71550/m.186492 type:complete len:1041 (-) Transcript_71550:44-3166(-)